MAAMIKLFGHAKSRASRSLWMLEELGVRYEHVPVLPGTESRAPEYLRINPNGHIPTLDHEGLVLWESLAINLYLAERLGSAPLCPRNVRERGLVYQWSFWAANEVEAVLVALGKALAQPAEPRTVEKPRDGGKRHGKGKHDPAKQHDAKQESAKHESAKQPPPAVGQLLKQLAGALGVLDSQLEQPHLLGTDFTVADLNLAATLREPGEVGIASLPMIELAPFPRVSRWLDRCAERAANRRVAALAGPR
jgi:glutathione S-transferase